MKQLIKIGTCLLFAVTALTLAGCGSHDQSAPSTTGGTPPEIIQNSKNQQQQMQNHLPAGAQGAPAAPATH